MANFLFTILLPVAIYLSLSSLLARGSSLLVRAPLQKKSVPARPSPSARQHSSQSLFTHACMRARLAGHMDALDAELGPTEQPRRSQCNQRQELHDEPVLDGIP